MIGVENQMATSYFPAIRKKDDKWVLRRVICKFTESPRILRIEVFDLFEKNPKKLRRRDRDVLYSLVEALFMPKSLRLFGGKGYSVEKINGMHNMFIYQDRANKSYLLNRSIRLSSRWRIRFLCEDYFSYVYGKTFLGLRCFYHKLGSWNSTYFSAGRLRHVFSLLFKVNSVYREPFPVYRILRYIGLR